MCSLAFLATLWLAASIVTYKLGLAVEWGFLQLHVQSVILHQRSSATDVYFNNCITKTYNVGHPHFHCSSVITMS